MGIKLGPTAVLLLIVFASVACSAETSDVTFSVEVPPADSNLLTRVEADLSAAENVTPIGTVTGPDQTVMVVTFQQEGEDCVAVYNDAGWSSGCGVFDHDPDQIILISGSDRERQWFLLDPPTAATEVRVTTIDGTTYSAPLVGEYGYIEFASLEGSFVLSIWNGDEQIYGG